MSTVTIIINHAQIASLTLGSMPLALPPIFRELLAALSLNCLLPVVRNGEPVPLRRRKEHLHASLDYLAKLSFCNNVKFVSDFN